MVVSQCEVRPPEDLYKEVYGLCVRGGLDVAKMQIEVGHGYDFGSR